MTRESAPEVVPVLSAELETVLEAAPVAVAELVRAAWALALSNPTKLLKGEGDAVIVPVRLRQVGEGAAR